jgi:hypothetical protein
LLPALPACRGREVGNSCRSTSRSGHVTSRRPRAGRRAIEAERSRAGSTSEGSRTKRTQANEQNHLPFSCTLVRRDPHAEEATHTHTHTQLLQTTQRQLALCSAHPNSTQKGQRPERDPRKWKHTTRSREGGDAVVGAGNRHTYHCRRHHRLAEASCRTVTSAHHNRKAGRGA